LTWRSTWRRRRLRPGEPEDHPHRLPYLRDSLISFFQYGGRRKSWVARVLFPSPRTFIGSDDQYPFHGSRGLHQVREGVPAHLHRDCLGQPAPGPGLLDVVCRFVRVLLPHRFDEGHLPAAEEEPRPSSVSAPRPAPG